MTSGPADSFPGWDGEEPYRDAALTEAVTRLENGEPLTVADEAALARLGPDAGDDDRTCPPEEYHAWMADRAGGARGVSRDSARVPRPARAARMPCPARDVLDAGFTHRGAAGGAGFAAGGVLDRLSAGWLLAMAADRAWDQGLGGLSDDELAGLACAARRNGSRQAALELAAIGALAARRAGPDGVPGEHLEDEVAALLTLTGWSAARQVALAAGVSRLPGVAAALAAGRIDADKAGVFAGELILVEDDLTAAAIAAGVVARAPGLTTSQIRRVLRAEIASFDPQAAARRKEKARREARVEVWIEPEGTGAIAGRGLDPAAAIIADQGLDADARWLRQQGAAGTLDQLRVQVLVARLTGQTLRSLLPQPPATGTGGRNAGNGPVPAAPLASSSAWPGGLGGSGTLPSPGGAGRGGPRAPAPARHYGILDAATCRDLADALAVTRRRARWCLTLVDRRGRAVAHGCARAGPGPPGGDRGAWLASVTITPVETGTCAHRRESAGYRPAGSLRHLVKIRSPRCGYPGCGRRAGRCDDDHTIPYHQGGKTCECNLHPLCRRHHRAKQTAGWHLAQPEPGVLTWTLPCGRTITTTPEPYPA